MSGTVTIEVRPHNRTLIARLPGPFGLDEYAPDLGKRTANKSTIRLHTAIMQIVGVGGVQVVHAYFGDEDERNIIVFAELNFGDLNRIRGDLARTLAKHFPPNKLRFV